MKLKSIPVHRIREHEKSIEMAWKTVLGPLAYGVCVVDELGIIQYVNRAYCHMFRQPEAALVGHNVHSAFHDQMMIEALRKKKRLDGTLDWRIGSEQIFCEMAPMSEDGQFRGIVGTYRVVENAPSAVVSLHPAREKDDLENPFPRIVTRNTGLLHVLQQAKKAARTKATVLLRGESGAGKELVAQAIHDASPRKSGPFIAVNCGALPENLIESELFGHEEGAFTGAQKKKIGRFEQAEGGTLFLDEIGDLPLHLQVKLLRVLQEKSFTRIGGMANMQTDVRIIAATHVDVEALLEKGLFREDLYYRLNVLPLSLPALRERPDDIRLLVDTFVEQIADELEVAVPRIHDKVYRVLEQYPWPGNVRELRNVLERMLILCDDGHLDMADVPTEITKQYSIKNTSVLPGLVNTNGIGQVACFEAYEKEIIDKALQQCGSFNAAGKVLGLTHKTVAAKARKYGLRE